jgi:hypothetical protein
MHTELKSENGNVLVASMKISYRIDHEAEAYTVGEKLVKPSASDLAACMIHKEADRNIQLVSLSDNMMQGRIKDCTPNILYELFRRIM